MQECVPLVCSVAVVAFCNSSCWSVTVTVFQRINWDSAFSYCRGLLGGLFASLLLMTGTQPDQTYVNMSTQCSNMGVVCQQNQCYQPLLELIALLDPCTPPHVYEHIKVHLDDILPLEQLTVPEQI